jgi:hypothetical protein
MKRQIGLITSVALIVLLGVAGGANAQLASQFFAAPTQKNAHPAGVLTCKGPLKLVTDVAFEGFKTTAWNWAAVGGGGEGGRFDPTPALSTTVTLVQGTCLNAHFSAIVGSRQTYGAGVASIAMFQVSLTPLVAGGLPQHMVGHYETPYGVYAPSIGVEAERDVDTFGANFFQRVGTAPGDVPPGNYKVDVWWSGGPVGGGGAFAGGLVLKLYQG